MAQFQPLILVCNLFDTRVVDRMSDKSEGWRLKCSAQTYLKQLTGIDNIDVKKLNDFQKR